MLHLRWLALLIILLLFKWEFPESTWLGALILAGWLVLVLPNLTKQHLKSYRVNEISRRS